MTHVSARVRVAWEAMNKLRKPKRLRLDLKQKVLEGSMWQYQQMVSGTGNAIDEEPSVGNRYRYDWGLAASAGIVRPPSSSRRGSTFGREVRSRLRATLLVGSLLRDYDVETVHASRVSKWDTVTGAGSVELPLLHRKGTGNVV
ncbi:hypothetical protein ALO83_103053 [Pseudomonas cannabina pv. alisalensis]|uniref:Uncharacterized protein n=1 Tax=Pseudomonas cannabina TaxID=86840 RepID=A0A3M3S429_PSECA|nr:hypothetical protein ALO83_103053 [Pseudomonas cannabina pv. alisalensis]RMN76049.1 hypothetical protein ALQ53_102876 [Pseudomonas cannabina]RMN87767.1 hypothetical protein ALQ52_103643 [Pseudomonas cannabina pv. alisalensis]RMO03484.1 hypothetical protein ALQ51_101723 [Pseudomonas cannabina]